jgi:hypothetical protein
MARTSSLSYHPLSREWLRSRCEITVVVLCYVVQKLCRSYAAAARARGVDDTLGIVDRRRPGRSTGITLARRHRSLRHVLGVVQSLLEATRWDVTVEVAEGRMVSRCAFACLCGL